MTTPAPPHGRRHPAFGLGRGGGGLTDDEFREVVRLARALPSGWLVDRGEDGPGGFSVLLVRQADGGEGLTFALFRSSHGVNLDLCWCECPEPLGTFGTVGDAMARVLGMARALHVARLEAPTDGDGETRPAADGAGADGPRGGGDAGRGGTPMDRAGRPDAAPSAAGRSDACPPFLPAPFPPREAERLAALHRYRILDTPDEEAFDRLARLAREMFGAQVAQISLVDGQRRWIKARAAPPGPAPAREAPRSWSFCAHAISGEGVFVVPDARADARFRASPFVAGGPRIRFYAGAPLRTPDGHNVGTLCVLSPEPRGAFGDADRRRLRALADMVVGELELRRSAREAEEARTGTEAVAEALRRANAELAAGRAALEAEMAERARAEAALREAERLAVLGRLAGGLAQGMSNALQGIGGGLELARLRVEQARAPEALALMDAARRGVDRAASLTRRLLAFARCDALRPEPVGPGELVEGLAELIRCTVGPEVAVVPRPGGSCWPVLCDPGGLESALLDLAANARDAMPGGGTLTLSTRDVRLGEADAVPGGTPDVAGRDGAEPGDYVEIAVCDTGTAKPVGRGTRLGLSRVHGFARQSGGFVRLDSAPGRGTTARLYLRRHRPAPPAAGPADAGAGAGPAARQHRARAGMGGSEPSGPGSGAAEGGASCPAAR